MIKYYSSENENGVFIVNGVRVQYIGNVVDGVRVQYIGNVKDLGYWYWDFFTLSEDINNADFFETVFDDIKYKDVGFSEAWYDDIEDVIEKFNLELDKEVIDYFKGRTGMGDYYYFEINVALNGKHFFATAPRSITTFGEMLKSYKIFKEKFPKSEGYEISVTHYATTGKFMNLDGLDE